MMTIKINDLYNTLPYIIKKFGIPSPPLSLNKKIEERKQYYTYVIESLIYSFTVDQMKRLLQIFVKKPHLFIEIMIFLYSQELTELYHFFDYPLVENFNLYEDEPIKDSINYLHEDYIRNLLKMFFTNRIEFEYLMISDHLI